MNAKQLLSKGSFISAVFAAAVVFSSSSVYAQVKIGTNPTTIEPNSNLEVEASTPDRKFKVNKSSGQVTIKDGTQSEGYILSSDAEGNATWAPPSMTGQLIEGQSLEIQEIIIDHPTVNSRILDSPLTLNKGVYNLLYYAQYNYYQPGTNTPRVLDPTNAATAAATWPKYIYLDFITESGSATFPSYRWALSNQPDGPHVIPTINTYQVASKITQLVIVNEDNTVIKPRFWGISAYGTISNTGPIIAIKQ